MRVLKFGGSSVGTASNILSVKQIVESIDDQVIVVVSALGGITDKLIETSKQAAEGKKSYAKGMKEIISRHVDMVYSIIPCCKNRDILLGKLNLLFKELHQLLNTVYKSRQLSAETSADIVSYGERMSSLIVSCLIKGSSWFDSRDFIKTEKRHNKYNLDSELTEQLVRESLSNRPKVSLVPGFISTDKETGETTNLGRGGSDYTASIIASALEADCLEIWTDVDGFMTADPRVITEAHPIDELSYEEAIELCNYGAKVIYPPTIKPVCNKAIPILIKNTMHPEAPGTIIKRDAHLFSDSIKGISSIKDASVISVETFGTFPNEDSRQRITQCMKQNEIDIFWMTKPRTPNTISMAVHPEDTENATKLLRELFVTDTEEHARTTQIHVENDLSMITIVGENMRQSSHIIHGLLNELMLCGINVLASSQGDSDTNLSLITEKADLCKAMNITHDYFFEPTRPSYVLTHPAAHRQA